MRLNLRNFARRLRRHQTDAERLLWKRLRARQIDGFKFRRQHPIDHYIVDFCCLESHIIVEVDGGQHASQTQADQRRTDFLVQLGYRVLRYWDHEVLTDPDAVLQQILATVNHPHPNPLPEREREKKHPQQQLQTNLPRVLWMAISGVIGVGSALAVGGPVPSELLSGYGLGRPASEAEIKAWNIDVSPSGEGLPPGSGSVPQGAQVYAVKCSSCHGPTGIEGPMDRLVGGKGTLASQQPIKTVGNYWPYATTLYDYIHRAMPFNAPQSLTPDEVYAVVAWILHQNGILAEDAVLDARSLAAIQMPNRKGFVPDPRPDVPKP